MRDALSHQRSFAAWKEHKGAARVDTDFVAQELLSSSHPEYHLTRTSPSNCDLLGYARAGFATATRKTEGGYDATRAYRVPASRLDKAPATLEDAVNFGRWAYQWQGIDFIVYQVSYLDRFNQKIQTLYVLAPNTLDHVRDGYHEKTDGLLVASGEWTRELHDEIWIFDDARWIKSKRLWKSVQGSSWDDVILDPTMKAKLIQDIQSFFDNQELYQKFNIPWKRGVIFYGVPGNGKTISIKALINSLAARPQPVQSLYVKSLDACSGPKWSIQQIFQKARRMAPCLLIFEDLDSLVSDKTRSYFLNEVDGLESNDGILMVGSTNHLDRLDAAVTKRPSRFDRKYHFKIPSEDERIAYCRYWRTKFAKSDTVDFPDEICPIIAKLTEGYSFAYLKELFVTSLFILAHGAIEEPQDAESAQDNLTGSDTTSNSDAVVVETPTSPDGKDEGSADGESSEENGKTEKQKKSPKTKLVMPEVEIPETLQGNLMLKIVKSQARILLEEMNNATNEIVQKTCGAPMPDPFRFSFNAPLFDGDE